LDGGALGESSFLIQLLGLHYSLPHLHKQTPYSDSAGTYTAPRGKPCSRSLAWVVRKHSKEKMQEPGLFCEDFSFMTVCEVLPDLDDL
jgi:hypothetical protein